MDNIDRLTDIILNPLKGMRGKRYDNLKQCTVEAHVHLNDRHSGQYHHPFVTLKKVRTYDNGERCTWDMLTIRYQRNDVRLDALKDYKRDLPPEKPVSGFLASYKRCWSGAYAAKISGDLSESDYMQTALKLIDRANEAIEADDKLRRNLAKRRCQLLKLIAGLQRIGVTVVLHGAKLWRKPEYSLAA